MKSTHFRQLLLTTALMCGAVNLATMLPTTAQTSPSTPDSQLPPVSPTTPNSPTTPSSSPQTPTTPTRSTDPSKNPERSDSDSDLRPTNPSTTTSPTTPTRSTYPNRRNNSTNTTSPTRTTSPSQTTSPTRRTPLNRSTNYNTPNNSTNTNSPTRPTSPSSTTSPTPRSANPQPNGIVQTIALQQSSPTQTSPTTGQPGAASLNSVDRQFAMKAAQSDMTEIQTSQLALNRSKNPQILKYAQEMIQAHTDSTAKLKPIATRLNLAMPKTLGAENQSLVNQLNSLSGTQFDLAYTSGQARAHARTQSVFQTELQQGKNPQLKAFANEILPVVSMHLQMAKSLTAMR